jgi:glycosyltransferase involved in cell wall biosynthesis
MRILMLSQFYPPTQGGEEQAVRNLSVALASRGHRVAVATLRSPDLLDEEVVDGVQVYRIQGSIQRAERVFSESGRRHAPPFPDPELMLALYRIVRRERPHIVHAHNWLGYQYLPLKWLGGPRLVRTMHDMSQICATKAYMFRGEACTGPGLLKCLQCSVDHYGPSKGLVTLAGSTAMNAAERHSVDMYLPVSESAAQSNLLSARHAPYRVIPNFLSNTLGGEESGYANYVEQLPSEPFILFVGGFRRLKGIQTLLEAYRTLDAAPRLVLIGYDALDTPTSWPQSVTVLRNWPHGAVMQAWRRCLFGVVPSLVQESFGLVVLEAMASGKAVVASRIGGLAEVVAPDETGILVPPGDVAALREAMQRLIASPDERQRLARAALVRVAQYRQDAVVEQVEQLYASVLRGGNVAAGLLPPTATTSYT